MKPVKIIKNLYLGDMHSVPMDCDIEIAAAREIFIDKVRNKKDIQKGFFWDEKILYLDFHDYPMDYNNINKDLISIFLKTIRENIHNKKIYVHCVYGINRSPSLVFLYLLTVNQYKSLNLNSALSKFRKIYPRFSMNPGWDKFIERYYPFDEFK